MILEPHCPLLVARLLRLVALLGVLSGSGSNLSCDGYFQLECAIRDFFLLKANFDYSGAWDSSGWADRDAASSVGDRFSAGSETSG